MSFSNKIYSLSIALFAAMQFFAQPAVASHASLSRYGEPTVDPSLERRIQKPSLYKIKQGDSLSRVAHFLYGHYSWWIKLKKQNPQFHSYGEDDTLPVGQKLTYLAPEVADIYEVRQNDWLARIAQWKYGDSELWQELFRKNMANIKNPDLIHPGDKLILGMDGTVQNANTGQVLMEGAANLSPKEAAREIATKTEDAVFGFWAWSAEQPYFFFGFLSGLTVLLCFLAYALFQQFRFTPVIDDPRARLPQKPVEEEEEEQEQSTLRQNLQNYPNDFKRRPLEDPTFDRSLMREEEPEIDLRPSYNRLFGRLKSWKNYLNSKRKK